MYVEPLVSWAGTAFTVVWPVVNPGTGLPDDASVVTGQVTLPDGVTTAAMVVTRDPADPSVVRASHAATVAGTHAYRLTSTGSTVTGAQGVVIVASSALGALPIELDPTTSTGAIRLLIGDLIESDPLFTDAQLAGFYAAAGSSRFLAAAMALETIAVSEALVSKKITTQDLQTDGPAVAKELRALAAQMRKNADEVDEDGDTFSVFIVPFDPYPTARRW